MTVSQLSYSHGLTNKPLINDTIGVRFDQIAEQWPDYDAVVVCDQNVRLSFRELQKAVNDLAAGLLALGLQPGDRIGIWSPNNIAWVLTQYATAKAGLIMVNINPAYRLQELEYALNKVECRALITAVRFKTSEYITMLHALAPEIPGCEPGKLKSEKLPHLTMLIQLGDDNEPGFYNFDDVQRLGRPEHRTRLQELAGTLQADDAINIQFTSGTTGLPKAATLSHHNVLNNTWFIGERMGLTAGDRYCMPLPLYHAGGMMIGALAGLNHGVTMVYPSESFDTEMTLRALQNERCTALGAVPTMFIAMLNHPTFATFDLSRLRKGWIGGAPCPVEIMRRIIDEMHMRDVTIVYGMTETGPISTQTTPDDSLEQRVNTVGRVHPHVEVKIVDPDGRVVPRGGQGEICTRGYLVMLGYWNDAERNAGAIDRARWMHTGDLGVMDENGYVAITGRAKDMVIRGGVNIYPREVEEFLYAHPAVADVQVFGVPDDYFGEELCAWIKLKPDMSATADDIRGFCRDRISHFKIPRHVRFVESYPMTVTGKIQKFAMRDLMTAELLREKQSAA